jgi:hypothetical protein
MAAADVIAVLVMDLISHFTTSPEQTRLVAANLALFA